MGKQETNKGKQDVEEAGNHDEQLDRLEEIQEFQLEKLNLMEMMVKKLHGIQFGPMNAKWQGQNIENVSSRDEAIVIKVDEFELL